MLRSLRIENIAVIKDAEIEFDSGFTVLTGETGAGKSMIIDGINLLLGDRASKEVIRSGASRASVTAMFTDIDQSTLKELEDIDVFPDEDGALFLSRIVTVDSGDGTRSQSKINGHNVPTSLGRTVGRLLVDIHGQNDNQKLLDTSAHVFFVDSYADMRELLAEYSSLYDGMSKIAAQIKELKKSDTTRKYDLERAKAENAEIDALKLKVGEEEELNERRGKLINLDKLKRHVNLVYKALLQNEKGVTASYMIERAATALTALDGVLPSASEMAAKLLDMKYDIEDIAEKVHDYIDGYDGDPTEELNRTEQRLDGIAKLKRKFSCESVSDILELRKKNAELIEKLENSDGTIAALIADFNRERVAVSECAAKITARRREAGDKMEREILETLRYLDMPNVRFSVSVMPKQLADGQQKFARDGGDDVEFLIATNPGEELMSLSKIASGGELARIMLALKSVLSDKAGMGTVIYDEIDTGISGSTSQKIGVKLKEISKSTQVFCVTHSAQIASVADRHCFIKKKEVDGRAETSVTVLDGEGRISELARIIGGMDLTEKTLDAARELLEFGRTL